MLSLYEILKASKTGIAPDMWTALAGMNWSGADSGHEVKELTGIPPLSFTADGTPLLDYLISGNMSQTGTPTPTTPIQPSECGERTGNLWSGDVFKKIIFDTGYYRNDVNVNSNVIYIPVIGGSTYTFSISNTVQGTSFTSVCSIDKPAVDGTYIVNGTNTFIRHGEVTTFTRTIPDGANWWAIQIRSLDNLSNNIMINEGSTPLPYEPYGYFIEIEVS